MNVKRRKKKINKKRNISLFFTTSDWEKQNKTKVCGLSYWI